MNPVLTSAWEISGVMEEPILPFITLPPPVMVPEFQETRGLCFRRISRQGEKIKNTSQVQLLTSHLNNLPLQCDHSPAPVLLEGYPRSLLHVLGDQGVPQGKVESWAHALIFEPHHVKQPGTLLWGTDGGHVPLPDLHLNIGGRKPEHFHDNV